MNRIKELRTKGNLTQKSLAIAVSTSQKSIANWEAGHHNPNEDFTKKLCDFFKVSKDYLLGKDAAEEQKAAEPTAEKPAAEAKPARGKKAAAKKSAEPASVKAKPAKNEKAAAVDAASDQPVADEKKAARKPKAATVKKNAAKPAVVEQPADVANPAIETKSANPQKAGKPAKKQAAIDEDAALNEVLQKFIQDFVRLDGHGKNAMLQLCKAETERCEQQKTLADENTYLCAVKAMRVK